jgi:hypothetical protein
MKIIEWNSEYLSNKYFRIYDQDGNLLIFNKTLGKLGNYIGHHDRCPHATSKMILMDMIS